MQWDGGCGLMKGSGIGFKAQLCQLLVSSVK